MLKPLRIDIITLGDELLLGIRDNTHLTYFGQVLARHGLTIQRNIVIRDEADHIERYFTEAWNSSDIVITTGGLGPTTDDVTRETLAVVLGHELWHDPEVEQAIRDRFARIGREVTDNNLRQAKILTGAEVLYNSFGTAPGMWLRKDGKHLIMLPGPPAELYPMFENQVIPKLQEEGIIEQSNAFLQLRTCGVGESLLETKLTPVFDRFKGKLGIAYCAHEGLVDVRLSPAAPGSLSWEEVESIGAECAEMLEEDFVGYGDVSIAEMILNQLRTLGKGLAVAESCTGGMLSNMFTDIPGASKVFAGGVVCYNNSAKIEMLGVPEVILQQHGAVSAECAAALATGASEKFGVDYSLSVTGFAGPGGGDSENPVGTIYLGYHSPIGVWSRKVVYPGSRVAVKTRAVMAALDWMRRKLKQHEVEDLLESMIC